MLLTTLIMLAVKKWEGKGGVDQRVGGSSKVKGTRQKRKYLLMLEISP